MINIGFTVEDMSHWTGGTNYLCSLIGAISGKDSSRYQVVVYLGTTAPNPFSKAIPHLTIRRLPLLDRRSLGWFLDRVAVRLGGRPFAASRKLRRDGISVHSHSMPSRDSRLKTIGWIPDFQHVHLPHLFNEDERRARDTHFHEIARGSDRVVVSSNDARGDFLRFAPYAAEKVRVLRFAALPQDALFCSIEELRAAYDIDRPYFYVPNQVWTHKNHDTLVEAVRIAAQRDPALLVLCSGGTRDYRHPDHFDKLMKKIADHGIDRNIRFLGLIPYEHIAPLMLHATAVVNPSLFEGWSTTVEEAKALGLPLILSDLGVHVEQAPKATFFPVRSAEALADRLVEAQASHFPQRPKADIETALVAHRQRIAAFGEDYLRIVDELGAGRAGGTSPNR